MSKQRYVTLGVALCAALGVHAFVLFYTIQPVVKRADIKPIQIDLLPQAIPMQEEAVQASVQQKVNTPVGISKTVKQAKVSKQSKVDALKPIKPLMDSTELPTTVPMPDFTPTQEKHEVVQALPQVISKPIQQHILAAIVYPRQAQRRGWEGSAKFSLDIQQEMIQKVTLLVSTGYKALDNAAQKGIATIGSLPLADGKHILPVSFHLQ